MTSSKAESFRTAVEQLSSPSLPPASAASNIPGFAFQSPSPVTETPSRTHNTDSIGLGIGLTDDDSQQTPTRTRPMSFSEASAIVKRVIESEEDTLEPASERVDNDPVIASEPSAVRELSRETSLLRPALDDETYQGFSYINDDDTPYKERPFFHEDSHNETMLAQSDLGSAHSVSPLSERFDQDDVLTSQARTDSRRVSQLSTMSMQQSVEVMVIPNVPKQRQKLRHANKNPSLRAASDSQSSNRSSLQSSSDYKPKLNRMLGKLPNATANSSLHSDSGISMVGSDHIMKRWSKLAATDIPRRQLSSSHSQVNVSLKQNSPVFQRGSASRPATAPSGQDQSPELRNMKRRTISTSSSNSRHTGPSRGRLLTSTAPPHIPKRTSSLGATNRDVSGQRSCSSHADPGPSESKSHGRSVSQPMPQSQPAVVVGSSTNKSGALWTMQQPAAPPVALETSQISHSREVSQQSTASTQPLTPVITLSPTGPDELASPTVPLWMRRSSEASEPNTVATATGTPRRSSKEDAALLASRALLKTPFSGHSVQSGFSGTYEVHEATAINIYPHTNSSLLVIQQATPSAVNFPAHPSVRPGAYRITEVSSPTQSERARQPESMHVKIEGPGDSPTRDSDAIADSPTLPFDSPLRNPRPAPKAPSSETGTLPSMKLIPPTPLDLPTPGASNPKAAIVTGPVSLVRRALSSNNRTSGHWLASGRKKTQGGITKKRSRPVLKDDNLSPFWRPKRFWDDEDEYEDDLQASRSDSGHGRAGQGSSRTRTAPGQGGAVGDDYFSRPVRNTLGFPQSRLVISGPASLVRRLSSIRRYRSLKRKKFPPATQPVSALTPSSLTRAPRPAPAPAPSTVQRRSSLPQGVSPVRVISPSPSAMARRRKSQKRSVRFEFNPMRGFSGTSGESAGWATRAMKKRSEKKAEKKRQELKNNIGRPRLETVLE